MKLYVTAIIKSQPEFLTDVNSLLGKMVEQTRNEEACVSYDLHQSIDDENVFVFYEIWADQQGLDEHNRSSHMIEFIEKISNKLQEKVQVYVTHKL